MPTTDTRSVEIEFPAHVDRPLRTAIVRGLQRFATQHGYPMVLDEDRSTLSSRLSVRMTVPAAAESSVRAALSGLDGARWRQARWALTHGRKTARQAQPE